MTSDVDLLRVSISILDLGLSNVKDLKSQNHVK
jgi:hypothetical protein